MNKFESIEEILNFAINSEQEAVDFYKSLADRQNNSHIRAMFLEFAGEEVKHKARLMQIKQDGVFDMETSENVPDLKISDYVVGVKPSAAMNYSDALVLAMNKEKAAFKLYMALSERTSNLQLKEAFKVLAIEESKHKLRFEIEYDEHVMREN